MSTGSLPPRFCPFCRECFEGTALCPDHELPLVDFTDLPRDRARTDDPHRPLAPWATSHGRGIVFAGAALLFVGTFLPCLVVESQGSFSLWAVAGGRAPNLYTIPCVALASVAILLRVRTPAALHRVRLAVFALPWFGFASLALTATRLRAGAELAGTAVEPASGVVVAVAALVTLLVGAWRLGVEGPAGRSPLPTRGGDDMAPP